MIEEKILSALNHQINEEHYNALFYLSLSSHANFAGYLGAQSWLYKQYKEELEHMEKICQYILDQNKKFTISPLRDIPIGQEELEEMFTIALDREKMTSKSLAGIRSIAIERGDQATEIFLQWFINEQVQEEVAIQDILNRLKISKNISAALLQIDQELGKR